MIGGLRSSLFRREVFSSEGQFEVVSPMVRLPIGFLLCFLIAGSHASRFHLIVQVKHFSHLRWKTSPFSVHIACLFLLEDAGLKVRIHFDCFD